MVKKKRDVTLKAAVDGWLRYCDMQGMSDNTISGYGVIGRQFLNRMDPDAPIRQVGVDDIEEYLLAMRTEVIAPAGIAARPPRKRSPKTILNMHIGLRSLWRYALDKGYVDEHVVEQVKMPALPRKPIEPLTTDEIVLLVRACEKARSWRNDPLVQSDRPTAVRDKMILCLLLETCLRCSEAVHLRISDVKLERRGGQVHVVEGKGGKDRYVPFGRRCAAMINDYLMTRPEAQPDDYLIVNEMRNHDKPMTRTTLGRLLKRMGERAGVKLHPHLLRTTGACMLAANGMTAFELKRVMGHSDIATTQRYVEAANIDLKAAMVRASPIDNLRL